jgi:ATP-dependent DNA helicase RecG
LRVQGTVLGSGENYNVAVDEVVSEPILRIIDATWDRLRPHLVQTRFSPDARFQTTYIYPESACREALVNAVAHRDYTLEGRGIEIYVYDDRMDVQSPGPLLSSVRIEDLRKLEGVHQSRNSLIARVLKEVGYMRELGEGLRRIFELMKGNEMMEPELRNGPDHFSITLHHQQMYTVSEKAWLDQFAGIPLDRNQRAVIVLGQGGKLIAPQDITDSLGIVDWDEYRQIVSSLQDLGIIESTLTDNQVYRQMREGGMPRRSVPRWRIRIPGPKMSSTASALEKAELPSPLSRELFVQDIPYRVNYKELLQFFGKFGVVSELRVPRGVQGTRGFCFLNYEEQSSATACMAAAQHGALQYKGRRLRVAPAVPQYSG